MYNFVDEITLRYSRQDAEESRRLLGDINLLMPRSDQYLLGKEHLLVFLSSFGMVVRVGDPLPCPEHDLILKPFKSIKMNKAVFEIIPGIECGIPLESQDMKILRYILAAEKYDFWDWDKPSNVGYLPVKAGPFKDRVAVVLDRGAVRKDSSSSARVKEFQVAGELTKRSIDFRGVQEKVFAPLREAMQDAWPDSTNVIDPLKMLHFWRLCRDEVEKRDRGEPALLTNKWEDSSSSEEYYKTEQARASSVVYGQRYVQYSDPS